MANRGSVASSWADGKNKVECKLSIFTFNDEGINITYCPALDLSGYCSTQTEADKSFEVVLGEYFKYTLHKKTLAKDLEKLGWTIARFYIDTAGYHSNAR